MAGKDIETNEYSQASSRIKRIRYIIAVLFIIFVIFAVFSYREDLTVENFRYLMKYVSVKPVTFGSGDSAQINFDSDSSTVTSSFKEDLIVASKTSVKIYDLSSKEILSSDVALMRPAISTGEKYFAVYDLGAKYVGIYNSFSKLWDIELDYPVYDVALDKKGSFCIATASKGYTSAVKVYNSNFENTFNWRSADKYAIAADICYNDGTRLAVGTLRSNTSGDMVSSLVLLSTDTASPLATLDFEGEMIIDVAFNSEGRAVLLTDKAIRFTDMSGKILAEEYFNSGAVRKFEANGEYTLLLINESLVGKNHTVIIFDADGNTYMKKTVSTEITDTALSDSFAFILGVEDITVLNIKESKIKSYPSERSYRSVELFDDENVYLVYDGLAIAAGVE